MLEEIKQSESQAIDMCSFTMQCNPPVACGG